jgi:phosphate transport system protein
MPAENLDAAKKHLIEYARFVEEMIEKSRRALVQRDDVLLSQITEVDEPRANQYEMDLEEECTTLIARRQPMGRDLRTLLMALRMTHDLERIADHAVNIAEAVRAFLAAGAATGTPSREEPPEEALLEMFDETIRMVDCGIRAFLGEDAALGQRVCQTDATVDTIAGGILDRISASMHSDPAQVGRGLPLLKIAGNLERIADLSTNIGEDAVYMAEGRVIKHHRREESR